MISVYFDESGTHAASPVLTVAGILSTDKRWNKFQTEWREILECAFTEEDRKCFPDGRAFFHMSDYDSHQGPYKGWDKQKHLSVIKQLIGTIRRRTQALFHAIVNKADYEEFCKDKPLPENNYFALANGAYTFCIFKCLQQVEIWANENHHYEPIAYIFESGPKSNKSIEDIRRIVQGEGIRERFRFGTITTADKRQLNPLQAADIIAFETHKEMMNAILPEKELREPRKSFTQILKGRSPMIYGGYCNKKVFAQSTRFFLEQRARL